MHPNSHVTLTDISPFAVESIDLWESIFSVKVDNSYHCKSYEIDEDKNSIDFIFAFSAAHHFICHRKTLAEISRVLKYGGTAAYIFEPVTQSFWYSMAYRRVNSKRPEVHEDLIKIDKIRSIAVSEGLDFSIIPTPVFSNRKGFIETLYYLVLSTFPFLQKFLPHTAILFFTKKVR